MQSAFLDYVVLRELRSFRGVIATNANFTRSDLGECDVTDADFTEAVIDPVPGDRAVRDRLGDEQVHRGGHPREPRVRLPEAVRGLGWGGEGGRHQSSGTWGGGK